MKTSLTHPLKMAQLRGGYLQGRLLVATPLVQGSCFSHSVVFICSHAGDGAVGLIVNVPIPTITCKEMLQQLDLNPDILTNEFPIHFGGPIDPEHAYVFYRPEGYFDEQAIEVVEGYTISPSFQVLRDIAAGEGPKDSLLVLGVAEWDPGQIEEEIQNNYWIDVDAQPELIFDPHNGTKWNKAAQSGGIDVQKMLSETGHA